MDTSMLMEMAHSKHATQQEKNAAVSQQFEAVLVKQFRLNWMNWVHQKIRQD